MLTLNHQPAVLPDNVRLRIIRENPLFTSSGDYTFELALPLRGCPENQRIFSSLHRPEMAKGPYLGRRLAFRLLAPPLHVEGTAQVVGVNRDEVRLQLLGGRSAFNAALTDESGRDRYIDELPLGRAYEQAFSQARPGVVQTLESTLSMLYDHPRGFALRYGSPEETDCCVFPIVSRADGASANAVSIVRIVPQDGTSAPPSFLHPPLADHTPMLPPGSDVRLRAGQVLAPQPYLVYLIERVFWALGFELRAEDNAIRHTWMRRLLVANARGTLELCHMLPHWTAREFVEQVESFFGVVTEFSGGRVRLVARAERYGSSASRPVQVLEHPLEAYTVEVDQDERPSDPFSGNVGYRLPDENPLLCIPDEVRSRVRIREVSPDELRHLDRQTPPDVRSSDATVYRCQGEHYAFLPIRGESTFVLRPVDSMTPLFRRPDGRIDVELKIVPVQTASPLEVADAHAFLLQVFSPSSRGGDLSSAPSLVAGYRAEVPLPVTSDSRTAPDLRPFSLGTSLLGKDQGKEVGKRDVLEVMLNAGDQHLCPFVSRGESLSIPLALGNPYLVHPAAAERPFTAFETVSPHHELLLDHDPSLSFDARPYPYLRLEGSPVSAGIYPTSSDNLRTTALTAPLRPERSVKWVIDFTDAIDPDPTRLYLIRSRRFLCEKLELEVTSRGLSPVRRGYFYEVE